MNFDFKPSLLPKIALAGLALWAVASNGNGFFASDVSSPNGAAQAAPAPPPTWKTATPAQRSAAAAPIRAQLDAFKRGEWDKAISYQSATLKQNFASTAEFRAMMETAYPHFIHFKSIEFGAARALGPMIEIAIELTGNDGAKVSAIYSMVKEEAGYRVDGVSGGATPPPAPRPESSPDRDVDVV